MEFQQTAYFAMQLDHVDEPYITNNLKGDYLSGKLHQVDAENIKLFDRFDLCQTSADIYNRYERFDIEDDETQGNITSGGFVEMPSFHISTPLRHNEVQIDPPKFDENKVPHHENQRSDECKENNQDQQQQEPIGRRRTRRKLSPVLDTEHTIISGSTYQTWLQSTSDIVSRKNRSKKVRKDAWSSTKVASRLELPPMVLIDDFPVSGRGKIYYAEPLLALWLRSTQPPHESASEWSFRPPPPQPSTSSSSPPDALHHHDPMDIGQFHSGVGSESLGSSLEKLRANPIADEKQPGALMGELRASIMSNNVGIIEASLATPRNSGEEMGSIPSSGSGDSGEWHHSEINAGRSNRKRPHPTTRHSGNSLEPVAEENSGHFPKPNFKLSRLTEDDLTPGHDGLVVETGPTQTQHSVFSQPIDKITDSIRMQMKTHFDTPGAPPVESLNKLTFGMNRKGAALLFYQTCVLASRDFLHVEQNVPYGEILISKGAKM